MSDDKKKEDAMNKLVADYIAQSIKLDIMIEFFGLLPPGLSNKCEQVAVRHLLTIDDQTGSVDMGQLIDWRKKVMVECAALARQYREKLLAEYGGISEADAAIALELFEDDGSDTPKGGLN